MEQSPSTPQSTHRRPSPQNPPPPPATALTSVPPTPSFLLPSATASSFPNPNANLSPAPEPLATPQSQQSSTTSHARPTFGTRPWPQQPSYSHFSLPSPPNPDSPTPTTSPISAPRSPRGEVAIGVPAQIPSTPPSPPVSFSSLTPPSHGQQSQNFHVHGMHRPPSLGSPGSYYQTQAQRPQTRPWLSPRSQGKLPLPIPVIRPPVGPQSFQPSSITQNLQHNLPIIPQQQPIGSNKQSVSHQQQVTRGPGSGSQRPTLGMTQSGMLHSGAPSKTRSVDTNEYLIRIVCKRSIQEIVNQITTFGCSLAKHRKSTTLHAMDIMLHLERNWNMTLPVFGGDEIKMYEKPVKKPISTTEMMGKSSGGPPGTNSKSHLANVLAANIGAPLKSQNP